MGRTTIPAALLKVHLRWLTRRDMGEVLEIERDSFERPWNERDPDLTARAMKNVVAMVAESAERVVGYMFYELQARELRVLRLAVAADVRRRGVGTQLVGRLLAKLSAERRCRLVVDVCETNVRGQLWLRSCGLRCTRTRRGRGRDVLTFEHQLPPAQVADNSLGKMGYSCWRNPW